MLGDGGEQAREVHRWLVEAGHKVFLASASQDHTVMLWNVSRAVDIAADLVKFACSAIHGGFSREQWDTYLLPGLPCQATCQE